MVMNDAHEKTCERKKETYLFYMDDFKMPISALQHIAFCPRQFALIYIDRLWEENEYTVEGKLLHEKVDVPAHEKRKDVKFVFGLWLECENLRIWGKADLTEFHLVNKQWLPIPIEYKRGKAKNTYCDEIQVCAQALCLEEMLGVKIDGGYIYYCHEHRRHEVPITQKLRLETEKFAALAHSFFENNTLPPAEFAKKCQTCSLYDLCEPKLATKSVRKYIEKIFIDP